MSLQIVNFIVNLNTIHNGSIRIIQGLNSLNIIIKNSTNHLNGVQNASTPSRLFAILSDKALAPLSKTLLKRFPEVPDLSKIHGFQAFQNLHKSILEELHEAIELLGACADFQETCEAILHQSVHLMDLNVLGTNSSVALSFMDAVVGSCKVMCMLQTSVAEKKIILIAYAKAFAIANGVQGASVLRLQNTFFMIFPKIAAILSGLQPSLEASVLIQGEKLRQLAYLNIAPEINGINAVPYDEMIHKGLQSHRRYMEIFLLGWLLCPNELASNQKSIESVRQIFLQYGHTISMVADDSLDVYAEVEPLVRLNNKLGRLRLSQSDLGQITQSQSKFHGERRDLIRHVLKQCQNLSETCSFIGTKFQTILSILGFARDEILWYFHNQEAEQTSKKWSKKETRVLDSGVTELLWLIKHLKSKIYQSKKTIVSFISTEIKATAKNTVAFFQNLLHQTEKMKSYNQLVLQIQDTLQKLASDEGLQPNPVELRGLRMNWFRFHALSLLPNSSFQQSLSAEVIKSMNSISEGCQWVIHFEDSLFQIASLDTLSFHRASLLEHMTETLNSSPEQARWIGVYFWAAEEFAASHHFTLEKDTEDGILDYTWATLKYLSKVSVNLVHSYAIAYKDWERRLLPSELYRSQQSEYTVSSKKKKAPSRSKGALKPKSELSTNLEHVAK
ncbi:Nck-associated protein 1 [Phlyctochytrium planicorne]|nr:Nck-associated protein 1 [Phlyctochytrium planicorne]